MREIRLSGSEGGVAFGLSLPLSKYENTPQGLGVRSRQLPLFPFFRSPRLTMRGLLRALFH